MHLQMSNLIKSPSLAPDAPDYRADLTTPEGILTPMRFLLITILVPALAFSTPIALFADDALGIRNAAARAAANARRDDESATVRTGTSVGAVIRVLLGVTLSSQNPVLITRVIGILERDKQAS